MALENSMLVINGNQIGGRTEDMTAYQTKSDNNLQTTDKTVVGGINEIKSGLTALGDFASGTLVLFDDVTITLEDYKSYMVYINGNENYCGVYFVDVDANKQTNVYEIVPSSYIAVRGKSNSRLWLSHQGSSENLVNYVIKRI